MSRYGGWIGCVVLAMCLTRCLPAETAPPTDGTPRAALRKARQIYGEGVNEARQARNAADALFDEYRRQHPCPVVKSPQEKQDFDRVISAYRAAAQKYEGTDVAAYCELRLCEPYKYRGEFLTAIGQAQAAAEAFRGTIYQTKACFVTGNLYLQGLRDARAAIPWFEKVARPDTVGADGAVPPEQYDERHKFYLSAQQQIAKCQILLGDGAGAQERYAALGAAYPQFGSYFRDALQFELDSDLYNRFAIDPVPKLDAMAGADVPAAAVAALAPGLAADASPAAADEAEAQSADAPAADAAQTGRSGPRPATLPAWRPTSLYSMLVAALVAVLLGIGIVSHRAHNRRKATAPDRGKDWGPRLPRWHT